VTDVIDMSTPVTRGELREELAQLEHRFDGKLEGLETRIDGKLEGLEKRIEHKFDGKLDLWGGALLARIVESEKRVLGELARHTQAVLESMTKQISAVDEKYQDLPGRTERLEAEVHALKQR
jgi:hypothetical protein